MHGIFLSASNTQKRKACIYMHRFENMYTETGENVHDHFIWSTVILYTHTHTNIGTDICSFIVFYTKPIFGFTEISVLYSN